MKDISVVMPIKTGVTKEYSLFHRMIGNRPVTQKHISEIEKVACEMGMLAEEIIVNEKMEIIDGQHRFEVCKKHNLPVRYAMFSGIGVRECQRLNINQRNWGLPQFVDSYAEAGNQNYVRLKALYEATREGGMDGLNVKVVASLAKNTFVETSVIKEERFKLSSQEAQAAEPLVRYVKSFIPLLKKIGSRNRDVLITIGLISNFPGVSKDRLYEKIAENLDEIRPYSNVVFLVNDISSLYNNRLRTGRVDISSMWISRGYAPGRQKHGNK